MTKSLEYSFLRFTGVDSAWQMNSQEYYEQFFEGCRDIIDLGCGDGDFVKLMCERGYHALGVDRDPTMYEAAQERKIPIIRDDVLHYLKNAPEESVDGFFSAHLVEHLHYEQVLELTELCYRALRPGGVLVLVTPNVRGLVAHLEMFWLHYGHVNFYHPRLLAFFLTYTGYESIEMGENPRTDSHLLQNLRPLVSPLSLTEHSFDRGNSGDLPFSPPRDLILTGTSWWKKLLFRIKLYLAQCVALPYIDWMAIQVMQAQRDLAQAQRDLARAQRETLQALLELDRPFECYVIGRRKSV